MVLLHPAKANEQYWRRQRIARHHPDKSIPGMDTEVSQEDTDRVGGCPCARPLIALTIDSQDTLFLLRWFPSSAHFSYVHGSKRLSSVEMALNRPGSGSLRRSSQRYPLALRNLEYNGINDYILPEKSVN